MNVSGTAPSGTSLADGFEPVSAKEEALWLFQQIHPDVPVVVPYAFRLPRVLRWWPLHEAVQHMVSRHAALRTNFPEVNGAPMRRALPAGDDGAVVEIETFATSPETLTEDLSEFIRRPFDITADRLIRVGHFTGDSAGDVICLVVHHLVADAASASLLVEGIVELYDCLDRGEEIPPRFTAQVPRFVEPPATEEDLRYWREHLKGAKATSLALVGDSPPDDGSYVGRQRLEPLPNTAVELLSRLSKQSGATPNIILLSVFYLLLARHGAGDDIVVVMPIDARTQEGRESVGYHVNVCGVRAQLDETMTFRELVRQTRETFLSGVLHARATLEEVDAGTDDSSDERRSLLSWYMFNFSPFSSDWASRYNIEIVPMEPGVSRFDLTLGVVPRGNGMLLQLIYREALFDSDAAAALLTRFSALLSACAAEPDRPMSELSIWSGQDRDAVTSVHRPAPAAEELVPARISRRIREASGDVAVRGSDRATTYGELSAAATALAGCLAGEGVGRGDTVGLWTSPGIGTTTAIVAVWSLGATPVPLPRSADPARLADLCAKLDVRTLVGDDVPEVLASARAICSVVSDHATEPAPAPVVDVGPDDSALVLLSGDPADPSGAFSLTHRELAAATAAMADGAAEAVLRAEGDTVLASVLSLTAALAEGLTARVSEQYGVDATPSVEAVRWLTAATDAVSSEPAAQVLSVTGTLPTISVTVGPADQSESLGRPLPGIAATVLDPSGRELPPGLPGRLHLGGQATDLTARWGWDGLLKRVNPSSTEAPADQADGDGPMVPTESTADHDDQLVGTLVSLWREILAKPELDEHSHFFSNGGTSILAGRLVARIKKQTEVRLPLKQVFTAPTPQQLAARVKELQGTGMGISRR